MCQKIAKEISTEPSYTYTEYRVFLSCSEWVTIQHTQMCWSIRKLLLKSATKIPQDRLTCNKELTGLNCRISQAVRAVDGTHTSIHTVHCIGHPTDYLETIATPHNSYMDV